MKKIADNPWLIELPRLVLGIFVILNIIAMLSYPGGTFLDDTTIGYSFTRNFLSDLGRTLSYPGGVNFLSSQLFNMTLILSGVVFANFYLHVRKVFTADNQRTLALIGSFFGVLGGFSLAGVGLTPADLYLDLHMICATWLFRFFFVASLCYSIVIYRHSQIENKYAMGYLVFTFSILLYIIISELGPSPKEVPWALTLQVVSQKMILLILMGAIYIQTMGLKKLQS
ncbi:MAG TPA: hypothetical protein DIS65_07870 [Candidatus Marinimicrobia bacterium]|jgi:hypothetical membrane protein|nr:hypothetical protein [Candidatus Neomarinimicrobiota bacterium]